MALVREVFLFQLLTMITLSLAASSKFRSAFNFQPLLSAPRWKSSSCDGKLQSSAAYGRTTFRHLRGDTDSWRMTFSSDESNLSSESLSSTSSSSTSLSNLDQYRNPNNLDDQVFAAISFDGGLKVTVATIRNLLNEMMIQHSMNPLPGGECIVLKPDTYIP